MQKNNPCKMYVDRFLCSILGTYTIEFSKRGIMLGCQFFSTLKFVGPAFKATML